MPALQRQPALRRILPLLVFPSVPSNVKDITAGNRHYSIDAIEGPLQLYFAIFQEYVSCEFDRLSCLSSYAALQVASYARRQRVL